jgi:23S rRNA (adenine2503-C2)-methyltransferase
VPAGQTTRPGPGGPPGPFDQAGRTDQPGPADLPGLAAPPGPAGQPGQTTRPRAVGPSDQAGRTIRPRPSGPPGRTGQPGPPGLTVRPGFSARRPAPPRHLADLDPAGRRAAAAELGQPPFRADQLSRHYFGRLTEDPAQMTDLPAASRAELAKALLPGLLTAQREQQADQGTTVKTLWRAADGAYLESVLMRYPGRVTMCVSSQAGCGMACPFCATGQAGLTRNLSTAEIVEQVVAGARALAAGRVAGGPGRVSNVVFMGMGEPLANYNRVIGAVRRLTDPVPAGLGMSQRQITVSTVGLVPAIRKLAAEELSVTLAVSLHAPDDELRDELVPVNQRWKVAEVLGAAWDYAAATGRRVSIEYALIRDINDQAWRAEALGALLAGRLAHVNLIPLNPTPGSKWTASRLADQDTFVARLAAAGVPVTVRDTRGREIDGACGQLAAANADGQPG